MSSYTPPPNPFLFLLPVIEEVWASGGTDAEAYGVCFHYSSASTDLPPFSFSAFNGLIAQQLEDRPEWRNNAIAASSGLTGAAKVALKRKLFTHDPDFALRVAQLKISDYAPHQRLFIEPIDTALTTEEQEKIDRLFTPKRLVIDVAPQ